MLTMAGRGRLLVLALIVMLPAMLGLSGCRLSRLPQATVEMMDAGEAAWLAAPIDSYLMTVEVDRPDDRRRTMVTVVDGEIVDAVVSYWDSRSRRWDEPYSLNEEQAFPFTPPGLFEMVRGAVEESGRDDIRVLMKGEPPFPQQIIMGPIRMDGELFDRTRATVTVRSFLPTAP